MPPLTRRATDWDEDDEALTLEVRALEGDADEEESCLLVSGVMAMAVDPTGRNADGGSDDGEEEKEDEDDEEDDEVDDEEDEEDDDDDDEVASWS